MDLFEHRQSIDKTGAPLAERMRPQALEEVLGQEHILGPGKVVSEALAAGTIPSLILWGPPGSGKTSLALLLARQTRQVFRSYSAVSSGIKELKGVIAEAEADLNFRQIRTLLFIDEIHRFNKAQQDAFLPYVERGTVVLVGATTENPSFEVIPALISRCTVLVLKPLTVEHLVVLLQRALDDPDRGLGKLGLKAAPEVLRALAEQAQGDARVALNALELAAALAGSRSGATLTVELAAEALQRKTLRYDKSGEEHYNLISALHKSVRGSDPDAALYWLGRMLEAGEDPHFLLRRMARMASEDIGLADPQALVLAVAARQSFDFIGLPEGKLALAELVVYLALAPKSNALYQAYGEVQNAIQTQGGLEVPLHIRNAPTKLMKDLEYGKDYRYAHDYDGHWVADDYLPAALQQEVFYRPGHLGWEGKKAPELEQHRRDREQARRQPTGRPEV